MYYVVLLKLGECMHACVCAFLFLCLSVCAGLCINKYSACRGYTRVPELLELGLQVGVGAGN